MSSDSSDRGTGGRVVSRAVEFVGQVLIPAGFLTAVLYYFGFVRERALFGHFGVDVGTLDFSTTDYVVRSAGAVFAPLVTVLVLAVIALAAHHALVILLGAASPGRWQAVWIAFAATAAVLLLIGVVGRQVPYKVVSPLVASLTLGAGAVLLEYAMCMASCKRDDEPRRPFAEIVEQTKWPRRAVLVGIAIVAAFWCTSNLARQNGLDAAAALEVSLPIQPEAVVYSGERLQISGPGVDVTPLSGTDSSFAYRYDGLRVLVHTDGTWFLLPTGWRHDNGATVVLLPDDTGAVRVDLRP
jgi:hypothetical protein